MDNKITLGSFLTIAVLICLLNFACSKKQDAAQTQPADSNAASESNSPGSSSDSNSLSVSNGTENILPQDPCMAGSITAENETDSNKPEIANPAAEPQNPAGLIVAIAYSDRPSVLIGTELLFEGDITGGVRIIKINQGTVEFEKNGTRWTQQAGEKPAIYWTEPNQ